MSTAKLIANRFQINNPQTDLLGEGAMGSVYRAIDTQTNQPVAVKFLKPHLIDQNPDMLERFKREGEALRQLNHPNIVKMLTAVEEEDAYYLVMEYVSGGALRNILEKQGKLPLLQVLQIALDIADALTRAHRLNIIHRDLKPDNILLAEDGTPRLADFGIAYATRYTTKLTSTGDMLGTLAYLSPEVCHGEIPDARADIWSFGVLLFEMLSGEVPFWEDSMLATMLAILDEPLPDLTELRPDLPPDLIDLIKRMLIRDTNERIPTVRLVGAELEALLHQAGDMTISKEAIAPAINIHNY